MDEIEVACVVACVGRPINLEASPTEEYFHSRRIDLLNGTQADEIDFSSGTRVGRQRQVSPSPFCSVVGRFTVLTVN